MGVNAIKGSFGIGLQSGVGDAATGSAIHYIPAASVNIQPDQAATSLPAEVGGGLWSQVSYKTGVAVFGDATFNVRANSIGWLLHAFAGTATSAGTTDAYTHSFLEVPNSGDDIPWCTIVRNASDVWTEQYLDCRVDTLRLDIPAAGIVTASLGFVGKSVTQIANPTETFDTSPIFETCTGSVKFEGSTTNKITRLTLDFANNLTRDERIIGSYYLDGVSVINKTCRITCETFLTDATWYNQVYNNGGTTWDPAIYTADLDVTVETSKHLGAGTTHGKLRFVFPNVNYMVFPISLAGNDIIRVQMTADVTLVSGEQPFFIETISATANYNRET